MVVFMASDARQPATQLVPFETYRRNVRKFHELRDSEGAGQRPAEKHNQKRLHVDADQSVCPEVRRENAVTFVILVAVIIVISLIYVLK